MESTSPQSAPVTKEGRIARSWRLATIAWRLILGDRAMLVIAVMAAVFAALAGTAIFFFAGYFQHPQDSRGHLALVGLIALYPMTLMTTIFGVALASAAAAKMDGRQMTVGEAFSAAMSR